VGFEVQGFRMKLKAADDRLWSSSPLKFNNTWIWWCVNNHDDNVL